MNLIARRKAIGFLILSSAAVAGAVAWRPRAKLADSRARIDLETLFPVQFDSWAVDTRQPVQLVAPDTAALLNKIYSQTLSRTYVSASGDRIMLSVAYGGDQSDATRAHRPEVCYPAQGFQVRDSRDGVLQLPALRLPVRQLVAQQGGRTEPITYWIIVGERVTTTGTQQKLAQLSYTTRGVVPDGMLVRVSSIDADASRAFAVHQRFVAQLRASVTGEKQSLVFGAPGG